MHIDYIEEEDIEVPSYLPPTPTHKAVLTLLQHHNASLHEVACQTGVTMLCACSILGELKRGGWVGVMRYKQEHSSLLKSVFFARRPREVLAFPFAHHTPERQ
jgi:hypothetical protein